jgi:hypothetical protein
MAANFESMKTENFALREYVLHLQTRLLETQGECPPPPAGVNLPLPHGLPQIQPPPEAVSPAVGANPLEVAAQAVAGLSRRDYTTKGYEQDPRIDEDARTAEEITRQLADGASEALPTAPM